MDGCLAEFIWPTPGIGVPIPKTVKWVKAQVLQGRKIIIHTSRSWADYEAIERWLKDYDIPYTLIVCGKLLAATYLDDRNTGAPWLEGKK